MSLIDDHTFVRHVIMPDRRTIEPDALAAFPPEEDNCQPVTAPAPLRGPWDSSHLAVMPITDRRVRALVQSVQGVANRIDALSIATVASTRRLARWTIGLAILCGLVLLALLAQTYLLLNVARAGR
jgi:hypothetical protein